MLAVSCGGGGGGGGAVSWQDSSKLHNGGGNSGWGSGNQTGGGSSFSGGSIELLCESIPSFFSPIDHMDISLVINGSSAEFPGLDTNAKKDVLGLSNGDKVSGILYIYLEGEESPRVAVLDETEITLTTSLNFKVPYKYRAYDLSDNLLTTGVYYSRDGIDLSAYTDSTIAGWECDGTTHYGSVVTSVRGDIELFAVDAASAITIPDVTLSVSGYPSTASENSGVYGLTDLTGSFTVKANPASASFPSGVKYVWSISKIGGFDVPDSILDALQDNDEITITSEMLTAMGISSLNDISTNSSNPDRINVNCTVKHDSLPSSEWKSAALLQIKIYQMIGNKPAPNVIGDIVFKDGSAMTYAEFNVLDPTTQNAKKAAAIAVIFDATNKLGISLTEDSGSVWAPTGTIGYDTLFATSETDGSGNWTVITGGDPVNTAGSNAATNYYPFYYCNNYTASGVGGWYLPSKGEFDSLASYLTTVNTTLSSLSGAAAAVSGTYWTSSQLSSGANQAFGFDASPGYTSGFLKNTIRKIRAIKKFD